uniref:Uncharacterized protein n=1 Tax=Arundo donax TaxID=35708 RepID=A0A0A8YY62_ARUDO
MESGQESIRTSSEGFLEDFLILILSPR